jgi:hypothetical protein
MNTMNSVAPIISALNDGSRGCVQNSGNTFHINMAEYLRKLY